jgi:DegV family protein with EDD domain
MPVRIVTDSACDLAENVTRELGIEVVPLSIRFGAEEYTDRFDLTAEQFYEKMAVTNVLPETAAPSPGAFEKAFRTQAEAGADAIVCVNLSSELSATIQAAQSAAASMEGELDLRVIDSRSITSGLGTQVLEAARAAADGRGVDEVVQLVEDLRSRTVVYGALDTLDNLKKGGRIGNAQALLGTLLSVKPIVDLSSGKVEEAGKARTRRRALETLRDRLFEQDGQMEHLCLSHGMAPDVDDMLALLEPRYARADIVVGLIGATIGAHGGPRVMGLSWVKPAST